MEKETGGPAFPYNGHSGMSLRDCFAIEAAKPMIASALRKAMSGGGDPSVLKEVIETGIPVEAYAFADAMLSERAKP